MTSIFVAMPSFPDTEVFNTLDSLYKNAKNPEDVHVGIHFSYSNKKHLKELKNFISNNNNIKIIEKRLKRNKAKNLGNLGTGISRCGSSSLYEGQDYFLQTDSHMIFDSNWDDFFIGLHKEAKEFTKNNKVVLTAYPGPHIYEEHFLSRSSKPRYPTYIRNKMFSDTIPGWLDSYIDHVEDKFIPSSKTCGSFIFGDKEFAEYTGLEEYIYFIDEEAIQTMNLIWEGFSLVFPNVEDLRLTHMYSQDINEFGGERMSLEDFCNDEDSSKIMSNNYLRYIGMYPEKADKFYRYSNVHPKLGLLKNAYIPESFNF